MKNELENLTHIYTGGAFEGKADPSYCPASVHETGRGVGFHQCARKGNVKFAFKVEGKTYNFCATHFPPNIDKKNKLWDAKYEAESKARHDEYNREEAGEKLVKLSDTLLPSIEWDGDNCCPVCRNIKDGGHAGKCQMAKTMKLLRKTK